MPEYYRVTIGRFYLQLLEDGKSPKEAMHETRVKFMGPSGKKISRESIYRYLKFAKRAIAAEARGKK